MLIYNKVIRHLEYQNNTNIYCFYNVSTEQDYEVLEKYNIHRHQLPQIFQFIDINCLEAPFLQQENYRPADILIWINNVFGRIIRLDDEEIKLEVIKDTDAFLIYEGPDNEYLKVFIQVIQDYHEIEIGYSLKGNMSKVQVIKQYDNPSIVELNAPYTSEQLNTFIQEDSIPVVMRYSFRFIELVLHQNNPAAILFVQDDQSYISDYSKVAQKYSHDLLFVLVLRTKVSDKWMNRILDYVNSSVDNLPVLMILDLDKMSKYKFEQEQELVDEKMTEFVNNYLEGKLETFMRTQQDDDIEQQQNENTRVIPLIGRQFHKKILQSGKLSFVFFYAEWCCEDIHQLFDKLSQEYKDIIFGKLNGQANDVKDYVIDRFPDFYVYNGYNQPIHYEGMVNEESIRLFLDGLQQ